MDNQLRSRYPGVRPFHTADQDLFFGREQDGADLLDMVLLEKLVVLFARSGYGKSSLLNAGFRPALYKENASLNIPLHPLEVRLAFDETSQASPLELLLSNLEKDLAPSGDSAFLDEIVPRKTLWYHFKRRQNTSAMIFDQFEEFFYFPQQQQEEFCEQLAELLYKTIPQDVRDQAESCTPEQQQFLTRRCEIKVLFAIRADRLDALDALKAWLPAILHKRFELKALDNMQARQAIVRPAALTSPGDFLSPPFSYDDDALDTIIHELSGQRKSGSNGVEGTAKIESFQLQIVCDYLETKVRLGTLLSRDDQGLPRVTSGDLPDFQTVYEDYYKQKITELPVEKRQAAQIVVEDGLLFINERTGAARRRIRGVDELVQEYAAVGVTEVLLHQLERSYVLRRETNALGDVSYEISHDTLIAPVLKARRDRETTLLEKQKEQERLEAEQRAIEAEAKAQAEAMRRKEAERLQKIAERAKRRANKLAFGAAILAVLALGSTWFAWYKSEEADKQRSVALIEKGKADINAGIALEKTRLAEAALNQADQNLRKAQLEETKAKDALQQVELEKDATEAERQRAEANFLIAQQKKKEAEDNAQVARLALEKIEAANDNIVAGLLTDAAREIVHLNYPIARSKLDNAAELGRRKPQVAQSMLELAYFHNESGDVQQAQTETAMVAQLLDQSGTAELITALPATDLINELRGWQEKLLPQAFEQLESRYYPSERMVDIRGGTYQIKPGIKVLLKDYRMAATETSVWQYALFLAAQKEDIRDEKSTIARPGWGWEGHNPIVNISWTDAIRYANWLSLQRGLTAVYSITGNGDNTTINWIDGASGFRLPTELEWEYAARGGILQDSFLYAGNNILDSVGWYSNNASNRTHATGLLKPNGLGLYDMSGNAREWCWNWYSDEYPGYLLTDHRDPKQGVRRVIRGGAFLYDYFCQISYRDNRFPSVRQEANGFRLVQD